MCVESAHRMSSERAKYCKELFDSTLACLAMLLPCEPCREFYTHAWSVSECPEADTCLKWVHELHTCVAYKIAGAQAARVPACDSMPSFHEWKRRLLVREGTGVSSSVLADVFVFMAFQIACDADRGRRSVRSVALISAMMTVCELFKQAGDACDKPCRELAHAISKCLDVWSNHRERREGSHTPDGAEQDQACSCVIVAVGAHAIVTHSKAYIIEHQHELYSRAKERVEWSRGSLPKWMIHHVFTC